MLKSRRLRATAPVFLAIWLSGCAALSPRTPFTVEEQAAAKIAGLTDVREWGDARANLIREKRLPTMLALSGGAEGGAYSAGILCGWTATGKRPHFSVVTGVSIGALIAPLAFLGPRYDPILRGLFHDLRAEDVYHSRGLLGILFGSSAADTTPLRKRIAGYVDERFMAEIAREHLKGRRLLILTTNLDAQRPVVWDIGRIAASVHPKSLELIRDILLASASVPGVFPPVMIDAEAYGRKFQEMHVDGGTTAQVFTVPEPYLLQSGNGVTGLPSKLYLIMNNKLEPEFSPVEERTFSIMDRALATVLKSSSRLIMVNMYNFSQRHRIDFNLTYIGDDFDVPFKTSERFDQTYMRALFAYGLKRGQAGGYWEPKPPVAGPAASRPGLVRQGS